MRLAARTDTGCLHGREAGRGVLEDMITFNPAAIRIASAADARALSRLAQLDSARPLSGDILVAEEAGVAVAARSLHDHRVIADPFRATINAEAALRARARALRAAEPAPSLVDRMRSAFSAVRLSPARA